MFTVFTVGTKGACLTGHLHLSTSLHPTMTHRRVHYRRFRLASFLHICHSAWLPFLTFILVNLFGLMWRGNPRMSSHLLRDVARVNICPCFFFFFLLLSLSSPMDSDILYSNIGIRCLSKYRIRASQFSSFFVQACEQFQTQWQRTWYALLESIVTFMPYAVHHSAGAALGHSSLQSVSPQGLHSP